MTVDTSFLFSLLIVFQAKQFIADFPLQREYMLKKVLPGWEFLLPLTTHCLVHAGITLAICLVVNPTCWKLAIIDFGAHFIMDRIKSGPRYLGRFNDKSKPGFWTCLGFDQMVHHFTHYYIIYQLIVNQ